MPVPILWLITAFLFGLGLLGTVVPGLPGITLIYAGILLHAFATRFAQISPATVAVFGLITAATIVISYIGSAAGARLGGGKHWAVAGTIIGAIAGAFAGPVGLFAGAFLGGLVGALREGQSNANALRVAFFSTLGVLGTAVIQLLLGIALIVAFLIAVAV